METVLAIDEILLSIMALLPEDKKNFAVERTHLHGFFYRLRDKYNILSDIPFDTTYDPYSEFIDEAFTNLEISSLIGKNNPSLDLYDIKPSLKNYYKKRISDQLSPIQLNEISQISKQFENDFFNK